MKFQWANVVNKKHTKRYNRLKNGLLAIGSAINGRDFKQSGRTLHSLGLDQLDRDALKELLHEGL